MKRIPFLILLAMTAPASMLHAQTAPAGLQWSGSWASAQKVPAPSDVQSPTAFQDVTVRQVVHLSDGGSYVRVRLSNVFGIAPLHFTSIHVAKSVSADSAGIDPATDRVVTFGGQPEVTIPAGAEYVSDPVAYDAAPLSDLAVTFHLDRQPAQQTWHDNSNATSYYVRGDEVSSPDLPNAQTADHWFQLSGVEVDGPTHTACVVAFGDSITDGWRSTINGNNRWPDDLAQRLAADSNTNAHCVLNEGISGNRLLLDGTGPDALSRLDRDVFAQDDVKYLIVLEGINDLGHLALERNVPVTERQSLVANMISAYREIITQAHAHGIKVIGATLTPFGGSGYWMQQGTEFEADRQTLNAWIRAPGHFDTVADFDKATRDPAQPSQFLPAYDSGDHLHPNPAGYRAMANAIPLGIFETR